MTETITLRCDGPSSGLALMMSRIIIIGVSRYILAFALLLSLSGCYSGTKPTRIGNQAPDFVVQDTDRKVALHDYRGQTVVLNFWATWCAPCVEEMPSLIQMANNVKSKNVTVI